MYLQLVLNIIFNTCIIANNYIIMLNMLDIYVKLIDKSNRQ